MILLLLACVPRLPLATLSERPLELGAQIPPGRDPSGALSVNADVLRVRVRGTGANRDSNDWHEVAPGVRLQCELVDREVAVSLFVDTSAEPGSWDLTCPVGGVLLPLEVEAVQ